LLKYNKQSENNENGNGDADYEYGCEIFTEEMLFVELNEVCAQVIEQQS
jgi:hypothetical protein